MVLSWTRHNDVPSTVTVDGYDIASICFMTDYVCLFHLCVPSPFLLILPSKTSIFPSHISNFFFFSTSHPPFQSLFPVPHFCFDCAASPYSLFFSIWRTHAPSLTTYRGIMGEHEIIMSFRPFNEVVLAPRPCHIWSGRAPSGFQTRLSLYSIVKVLSRYVWNLILGYLLYIYYQLPSLRFNYIIAQISATFNCFPQNEKKVL